MTKVTIAALVSLALLAVAAPPGAVAGHCTTSSTSEALFEWGDYYVVADVLGGVLIYEETNQKGGLQRGDDIVDNTCHGRVKADERVM